MLMVKLLITDDFSGVEKEIINRVMWREGCWLITFFFLWASRRNWSSRSWRVASHQRGLASSQQVQNNWSHTERGRAAAHRWLSSNNAVSFMNTEFSSCACLILGSWFQLSKGKTWVRVHLFHHKPVRSLSVFWNIKKKSNLVLGNIEMSWFDLETCDMSASHTDGCCFVKVLAILRVYAQPVEWGCADLSSLPISHLTGIQLASENLAHSSFSSQHIVHHYQHQPLRNKG